MRAQHAQAGGGEVAVRCDVAGAPRGAMEWRQSGACAAPFCCRGNTALLQTEHLFARHSDHCVRHPDHCVGRPANTSALTGRLSTWQHARVPLAGWNRVRAQG